MKPQRPTWAKAPGPIFTKINEIPYEPQPPELVASLINEDDERIRIYVPMARAGGLCWYVRNLHTGERFTDCASTVLGAQRLAAHEALKRWPRLKLDPNRASALLGSRA